MRFIHGKIGGAAALAAVLIWMLQAAPALAAPSGSITTATANSGWTQGTVAGSVTYGDCIPENNCKWLPLVRVEPSLPEYHCAVGDALSSDPNIRTIWSGGSHTGNETVPFNAASVPILPGVFGQRACLMVIYNARYPDPVCLAQKKILEELSGKPVECPPEDHPATEASVIGALMTVEVLSPIVSPQASPPSVQSPSLPATTHPKPPGVSAFATSIQLKPSGSGSLQAACDAAPSEACTFALSLFVLVKKGRASKVAKRQVGTVGGDLAGGSAGRLSVRLNKLGRGLLEHGTLRAEAVGTVRDSAGLASSVRKHLTLRSAARPSTHKFSSTAGA